MCYDVHRDVYAARRDACRLNFFRAGPVTKSRIRTNFLLGVLVSDRESDWGDLMRAAVAGDGTAYRRLLTSIEPALRSVARRGLRRAGLADDEAEDVVQEVLLAVHLKRHTWEPSGPIVPWIQAIARHKLVDALRRRGRRSYVPIEEVAESLLAEEPVAAVPTIRLEQRIQNLPDRQREVIRAVAVQGASIRETAQRCHMSEGAVRVALHRGLATLAASFGERKP